MTRRYISGFDILGMDRDPTPGDPDRIDDLARFYEEIRDDAQTGVRVLGRGGSLSRARGESMEKLRDMLDNLPRKLQQTVVSFDAAAQAYRTYARVLRDQQTRIDTAMDQATAVVGAARRTPKAAPAGATPEQLVEARAEADGIAGARAQLSAARQLAADARRLREAASARCNRELDDAADKAIKPPPRRNFFQRIGDFFRNNPIFRLIIDIVIAVVGVVLPVVGIVLAAVALVVTVAVQAANGNFELGTLLVGLVTLVPGAKLIGPFVRGAKSVAPGLVKTVSSGAEAFGTFGRNNTVISGALRFGGRAPALGKQVVADFGKGVVEEVATVGLNKVGNPNSEGFNAASIFGGAAAGAAAGGLFEAGADSFRKNSGDVDLDFRKGDGPGPSPAGGDSTPASAPADVGGSGTGDVGPSTGDRPTDGAAPTGDSGTPADRTDAPSRPDPVDPSPAGDSAVPEPSGAGPAPVDAPSPSDAPAAVDASPPSSAPAVNSPPTPPVTPKPDAVEVPPKTSTPPVGADADRTGQDTETGPASPQQPPADPAPGASTAADAATPRPSPESPANSSVPASDQVSAVPSAANDPAPLTPAATSNPEASGQVPPNGSNGGSETASEDGAEVVDQDRLTRADSDPSVPDQVAVGGGGEAPSTDGGPPASGTDTPGRPDPVEPSPAESVADPLPAGSAADSEPSPSAPVGGPSSTASAAGGSPTSPGPSKPAAGGEPPDESGPVGAAETGRAGLGTEPETAVSDQVPTDTDPAPKDSAAAESAGSPEPEASGQVQPESVDGGGEGVDPDRTTPADGDTPVPEEVLVDGDAVPGRDSTLPGKDGSSPPELVQPAPSAVPAPGATPAPGSEGSTTGPDTTRQQPEPATASTGEPTSADADAINPADAEVDPDRAREERAVEAANAIISGEASQAASDAIEARQGEEPEDETAEGALEFGFLLDEDITQDDSSAGDDTGFTKRFRR